MANIKEIQRDERFELRLSKEEKELLFKLAEEMGMKPGRLVRKLVLEQVSHKLENAFLKSFIKGAKKYYEITGQDELLKELEEGE